MIYIESNSGLMMEINSKQFVGLSSFLLRTLCITAEEHEKMDELLKNGSSFIWS